MNNSCGGGFLGLLCLLFIGLKLCAVIDWNWLLVLAPILVPMALGLSFLLAVLLLATVCAVAAALGWRDEQ